MAHFVAFCIGFQKNIPLQNPPGGEGGYMAAQGLYEQIAKLETLLFANLEGVPPPLNPLLVGMVYFYIVYKYWPLV